MCERRIKAKTLIRSDSAANWREVNPTLLKGELGYDETNKKFKVGDGTTAWNSLSYVENGSSGAVELEPIIIEGELTYDDEENCSAELNITEKNYQQLLKNKTAPLSINSTLYYPYWDYGVQEDGGIYIYYRQVGAYYEDTLNEVIIAIYWLPNGETYVDETLYNKFNTSFEPLHIEGEITYDEENYSVELNITEENYKQFLKNKTAPVVVNSAVFQVNEIYDDGDGLVYYYHIYGSLKYIFAIYWYDGSGRLDDMYTEPVGGSSGGGGGSLGPIDFGGTVNLDPYDFTVDMTITEEHYQQFLQNKTAPIVLSHPDDENTRYIFTPDFIWSEGGEAIVSYNWFGETERYTIAIYWNPEESYLDENYTTSIGSEGGSNLEIITANYTSRYEAELALVDEVPKMIITLTNSNCYYKLDINEIITRKGFLETDINNVHELEITTNEGVTNTKAFIYSSDNSIFNDATAVTIGNPNGMILCNTLTHDDFGQNNIDSLAVSSMGNYTYDRCYMSFEVNPQYGLDFNVMYYTYYIHYDEIGLCHLAINLDNKEI